MKRTGQALIEFCFGVTVFMLLAAGMVQVVRWTLMNLVDTRVSYDKRFLTGSDAAAQLSPSGPQKIRPLDPVMDKAPATPE